MAEKRLYYLYHLQDHLATPSQKDIWKGLSLLEDILEKHRIFSRSLKLRPSLLKAPSEVCGTTLQAFGASVQGTKALRDDFLAVKQLAEDWYPSLLNNTPTSSS